MLNSFSRTPPKFQRLALYSDSFVDLIELAIYLLSLFAIITMMHLCLALLVSLHFSLAISNHSPTTKHPTPTLPFTVAAFISPWPVGSNNSLSHGISGVVMHAQGGFFWVDPANAKPSTGCGPGRNASAADGRGTCPPGNQTVIWVDRFGQAWLVR